MKEMSKKRPLILVTNDDGIQAKGLRSLIEAVEPFGDIVIVAPDKPQSGMGHAITVNDVLRLDPSPLYENYNAYTCTGTPVRSEEHTSELQSRPHLVCRLLLEKKKQKKTN